MPTEIRHAIYQHVVGPSVHLMSRRGRLFITKCTGASLCDEFPGYVAVQSRIQQTWARRLTSSWGLHWACEEAAADLDSSDLSENPAMALLFSCKLV